MTTSTLATAARLFHALSDETRLAILAELEHGERCVCDLQSGLDAAQSRLSFHLKVLREAGLVTDRREGRWSYYTIVPEALAGVHDLVVGLLPAAEKRRSPDRTGTQPARAKHTGRRLGVVASCCR